MILKSCIIKKGANMILMWFCLANWLVKHGGHGPNAFSSV